MTCGRTSFSSQRSIASSSAASSPESLMPIIVRTTEEAEAMKKQLRQSAEPAARYLRIAGNLRRAIADGRYPVGAQLPTEHELCRQLGVSRFTVREAIRVLAGSGLVRRKPRAGTVVTALPDDTRYR